MVRWQVAERAQSRCSFPILIRYGSEGFSKIVCWELGPPRLYQLAGSCRQPARAGSQLVPAGTYRDRLRLGPGLAMRAGTIRPGARAYTTITQVRRRCRRRITHSATETNANLTKPWAVAAQVSSPFGRRTSTVLRHWSRLGSWWADCGIVWNWTGMGRAVHCNL